MTGIIWIAISLAVNGLSLLTPISPSFSHSMYDPGIQNWSCGATTSEPAAVWPASEWPASDLAPVNRSNTASKTSSVSPSDAQMNGDTFEGKKGLTYDNAAYLDLIKGREVYWIYNWKAAPGGTLPAGIEYVPMCWGPGSAVSCVQDIKRALAAGSTHVLSFNEPDHHQQADMTPGAAAALHMKIFGALSTSAKIGSPAITNGPAPMGIAWLGQFLDLCGERCRIDYIAYHWYGDAQGLDDLRLHTQGVIELAATYNISKVWLTEFGVSSGTSIDTGKFLKEALDMLDANPSIERYAYFMLTDGILVSANRLNRLGEIYVES
jgi:hypothetical protein